MKEKKKQPPAINLECPALEFKEDEFLFAAIEHAVSTYGEHYSGGIQTIEFIMSHATTLDALVKDVIKYIMRYGKKEGYNRKDLLKAVHYIALMDFYSQKLIEKQGKE